MTLLYGMASSAATHIPGEGAALLLLAQEAHAQRPALAHIVSYASVTVSRPAALEAARYDAIQGALDGYQIKQLTTVWHAGDTSHVFEKLGCAAQSIRAIQPITGDCQAATGAIAAALAVADVAAGNGPILATSFPPLGTQSALLIA